MNRASPEDINQAMHAVQILLDAGINFVPIPIRSKAHHAELVQLGADVIGELIVEAEKEEANECK